MYGKPLTGVVFLVNLLICMVSSAYAEDLEPRLLESKEPEVCQIILDGYRKLYQSKNSLRLFKGTEILHHPDIVRIKSEDAPSSILEKLKLRNENIKSVEQSTVLINGKPQILYGSSAEIAIDGPGYYATYALDSNQKFHVIYPVPGSLSLGSSEMAWSYNVLFQFKKNAYYLEVDDTEDSNELMVQRIDSLDHITPVCKIKITYTLDELRPMKAFSMYFAFFDSLNDLVGKGYEQEGTLRAFSRLKDSNKYLQAMFLQRPWTFSDATNDETHWDTSESLRVNQRLEAWSSIGIWENREFNSYLFHKNAAIQQLAKDLEKNKKWSLDVPKSVAKTIINKVERDSFVVSSSPSQFDVESNAFALPDIKKWFLSGQPLDWNQKKWEALEQKQKLYWYDHGNHDLHSFLSLVLDTENDFDAIVKIVPIDDIKNDFGKTLLMYAAHMNHYDATRKLLLLHASVNLVTTKIEGRGNVTPSIAGRSALMYAAENASLPVIRLLVDAGADVKARDSEKHTIDFYFSHNPRFTSAEKKLGLKRMLEKESKENHPIEPGFNCKNAHSKIEHFICADSTSALYDSEMAKAYSQLLTGSTNPVFDKQDQRDWLKQRNLKCEKTHTARELSLCVRQTTRARLHYLYERLATL